MITRMRLESWNPESREEAELDLDEVEKLYIFHVLELLALDTQLRPEIDRKAEDGGFFWDHSFITAEDGMGRKVTDELYQRREDAWIGRRVVQYTMYHDLLL